MPDFPFARPPKPDPTIPLSWYIVAALVFIAYKCVKVEFQRTQLGTKLTKRWRFVRQHRRDKQGHWFVHELKYVLRALAVAELLRLNVQKLTVDDAFNYRVRLALDFTCRERRRFPHSSEIVNVY